MMAARWSLRLPRVAIRTVSTKSSRSTKSPFKSSSSRFTQPPKSTPNQRIQRTPSSREQPPSSHRNSPSPNSPPSPSPNEAVVRALQDADARDGNPLDAPVFMPEDPQSILKENHPAISILANSTVVIQRQMEMMNLLIGFEQANRYIIMDPHGNHIGYLAEQDHSMGHSMMRQMAGEHRSFTTHVFDKHQKEVLRFHRPFSFISSRIRVYDPLDANPSYESGRLTRELPQTTNLGGDTQVSSLPLEQMRIIGEAQQQWAPLRRKYNLFLHRALSADPSAPQLTSGELPISNSTAMVKSENDKSQQAGMAQFAHVNEPFLSWDFSLLSADNQLLGSVNRNFSGFGREIFTETGVYALRMDAAGLTQEAENASILSDTASGKKTTPGMTLDQRAVMLATAVSIDFDYFSRRYAGGFLPMPLWIPMGGGEAGAAGAGAAGAGAAGAAEAGGIGAAGGAMTEAGAAGIGTAARGAGALGAGEGAIAGAGTMAGSEAMRRGRESQATDDASPMANNPYQQQPGQGDGQSPPGGQEDVWGEQSDFWGDGRGGSGGNSGGGSDGGGGGGGGDGGSDFFDFL